MAEQGSISAFVAPLAASGEWWDWGKKKVGSAKEAGTFPKLVVGGVWCGGKQTSITPPFLSLFFFLFFFSGGPMH